MLDCAGFFFVTQSHLSFLSFPSEDDGPSGRPETADVSAIDMSTQGALSGYLHSCSDCTFVATFMVPWDLKEIDVR